MGTRVKYDVLPELVTPSLSILNVKTVTKEQNTPSSTVGQRSSLQKSRESTQPSNQNKDTGGFFWNSWSLSLSLSNMEGLVKTVEEFLKKVDNVTKIITQILKIIRLFSGNVKSIAMLIKFIIKQVAEELKKFIDSLASTGLYMSVIFPNFDKKFPKYTIPVYGGFQEFITRVNTSCTSSPDPDAPKFENPNDKVGGVIIAMIGGVNDPEFLNNLVHNFKTLSKFFGFQNPLPTPPRGFKVSTGFYRNPKSGKNEMGVQIKWEAPDTPVVAYKIYKSTGAKAVFKEVKQDGVPTPIKVVGVELTQVKGVFGKIFYRYTDFDVKDGVSHSYRVYSVMGDDFLKDNPVLEGINSPIATPLMSVTPRNCIPVSELKKYTTLGINGELLLPVNFAGEWQTVTVRNLLGSSLDGVFKKIDTLTNRLVGMVSTGSDAMTQYLDFYAKRVSSLLEIVTDVRKVIEELMAFNLRGTFLTLNLPVESGGMKNFLDRFNRASQLGNTEAGSKDSSQSLQSMLSEDKGGKPDLGSPLATTSGGGIAAYKEQGIAFGVILLFGFPEITEERLLEMVPLSSIEAQKTSLENTGKAIKTLMKMLGLE